MMDFLRALPHRLRALLRPRRVEAELDDELRFHLEMETEHNLRRGLPPAEARREALLAFGGVERAREAYRDGSGVRPLQDAGRDLRHALRVLRRTPGFAAVAVLTLALGIGSATAVFSVVDGVLLRPLPYPEAERLQVLWEVEERGAMRAVSFPTYQDWRQQGTGFDGMAFVRGEDFLLRSGDGPRRLVGAFASGDFFRVMGTRPLLGRAFGGEELVAERVAVLSHHLWLQHFGGDRGVLGRELETPDGRYTVIGVMPPGFRAPEWADVWVPLGALPPTQSYALRERKLHADNQVIARLADGVSPERARAELGTVERRLEAQFADEYRGWNPSFESLPAMVMGDARPRVLVLAAAVALVLLVSCVNVAGLMLARASARAREISIRTALGAGRGRLVRQLLAESVVLALAGGAAGVGVAVGLVAALRAAAPSALPRLAEVSVDGRVLAFSLGLSLLTALLCGLAPAVRAASPDLLAGLKNGVPGSGSARRTVRARSALVVAEVALALVLAVGAGLLSRSVARLQGVELGFRPEGAAAVRIFPPPRYDGADASAELYRRLRERLAAVPGVRAAAVANHLPLGAGSMPTRLVTDGVVPPQGDQVLFRSVSPEYFAAMGSRVLKGRVLAERDLAGPGAGGVVVNRALANAFWPGGDPLGRTVTVFKAAQGRDDMGQPLTAPVVGVVEDERFFGLDQGAAPAVYVPYTWNPWGSAYLVVRTGGDPRALVPALRRAVLEVDPDLPVAGPGFTTEFHTLGEYLRGSVEARRLTATLLTAFAGSALLLALVGIAGVMAYLVAQRTREIGLRVALGARPRDVAWMVAGQTLRLAAWGIALGVAGALAATRVLRSQLYEVSATDPATFAAAAAVFAGAALLAGFLPARRAARVDPMLALRAD